MNLDSYKAVAYSLDAADPLKEIRNRFCLPENLIYFCNNSLGLPAREAFSTMQTHMELWSDVGVEGWFKGKNNWYSSHDLSLKKPLADILGAFEDEVVVMNSLTVNLHLLLVSFYQPTAKRFKILIDSPTFPSDLYALKSHLSYHGLDPDNALIAMKPKAGHHCLEESDIEAVLEAEGDNIALLFLSPVNFLTGQLLDIPRLAAAAKRLGIMIGLDLAHVAGNIPIALHEWAIDFALGCSYKYLCSGPGGPGIAYVHNSHHNNRALPRFAGWWGNDPASRFSLQLEEAFIPYGGASSWQVSTPSILSSAPLIASLAIFAEVGMERLRQKSEKQTAFLLELLDALPSPLFEVITPREPHRRGGQISLLIKKNGKAVLENLARAEVICDFRAPNIIRVTPSALYNRFEEIYRFVFKLHQALVQDSPLTD